MGSHDDCPPRKLIKYSSSYSCCVTNILISNTPCEEHFCATCTSNYARHANTSACVSKCATHDHASACVSNSATHVNTSACDIIIDEHDTSINACKL